MAETSKTFDGPVILSAPQGWGKTRHAVALCRELGKANAVDLEPDTLRLYPDVLYLTNLPPGAGELQRWVNRGVTLIYRGWQP